MCVCVFVGVLLLTVVKRIDRMGELVRIGPEGKD